MPMTMGMLFTTSQPISTYQVADWSSGPIISDFPHGILDTILMTDHSYTNCSKIGLSISKNFGET